MARGFTKPNLAAKNLHEFPIPETWNDAHLKYQYVLITIQLASYISLSKPRCQQAFPTQTRGLNYWQYNFTDQIVNSIIVTNGIPDAMCFVEVISD